MTMSPVAVTIIRNDNDRAFMERVYLEHWRLMYRVAYRIVRDRSYTEDIVTASFEALCGKIYLLRSLSSCKLRSYIVSTCRNTALNALKSRNRRDARLFYDMDIATETVASDTDVAEQALRDAEAAELTEAMEQLLPKERDLLQEKYLLQKTDAEIAANYGIRGGSVRYYLTIARRHLAAIMKEKEL
jgi:RNA polymerase sigma factor (sigma-70 family)